MADDAPAKNDAPLAAAVERLKAHPGAGLAGLAGVIGLGAALVMASGGSSEPTEGDRREVRVASAHGPTADGAFIPSSAGADQEGAPRSATAASPAHADYIVKFKNAPEVKEAIAAFRRDESAGRAVFDAWAADRPWLEGFEFRGGSYSGEAYLRHRLNPSDASARSRIQQIAERLRREPEVAYCDPDVTAFPGEGE